MGDIDKEIRGLRVAGACEQPKIVELLTSWLSDEDKQRKVGLLFSCLTFRYTLTLYIQLKAQYLHIGMIDDEFSISEDVGWTRWLQEQLWSQGEWEDHTRICDRKKKLLSPPPFPEALARGEAAALVIDY